MKRSTTSTLALMALALGCNFANGQTPPSESRALMPKKHVSVFRKYCFDCHDSETKEGGLDLEKISLEISRDIPTAQRWDDILAALNAGEMPPEDATQISRDEKTNFLQDLSVQMVLARDILSDTGGEITLRRLNRREYQNTLESLLGFRPDVSSLPDDDGTGGFDTSGASLFFSSDQFATYRATATHALKHVLQKRRKPEPKTIRYEGEKLVSEEIFARVKDVVKVHEAAKAFLAQDEKPAADFGLTDRAQAEKKLARFRTTYPELKDYVERPEAKTGAVLHHIKGKPPSFPFWNTVPGGRYTLRVRAGCYDDAPARERYLSYFFSTGNKSHKLLGHTKILGTVAQPSVVEISVEHPGAMKGGFTIGGRDYEDKASRYHMYREWQKKNGIGQPASIWIDYVEIEGPFFDEWPLPAQKELLPAQNKNETQNMYVRRVITRFATRATRGKTPDAEFVDKLTARCLARMENGEDQKTALIDSFALILSSPSFLYVLEPRGVNEKPVRLSDRELAIRLSYFLWSAPPDEELSRVANSGELSAPEVLKTQTQRLLRDSRSNRFIDSFAHQWLDMRRVDMFDFSPKYHPEFDEAIRHSARQEVYATIRHLMDHELPLETLLKSDFVVINDVLGDFYELAGVNGPQYRKVSLPPDSPRGGLLGAAATHIMGSDGQRSSPVERGVWVLRHLLNDPPPPAPANVPMLSRLEGEVFNARGLQKAHQEEPQCAQCHRKIDPIGYGLENFTAAGLWRDTEQVAVPPADDQQKRRGIVFRSFPIDPSGTLPRGEPFAHYLELRDAITSYRDPFSRGFTEHLIAYGLGRPYGISDHNLATEITEQAEKQGNTVSAFVHALVQSKPFHRK